MPAKKKKTITEIFSTVSNTANRRIDDVVFSQKSPVCERVTNLLSSEYWFERQPSRYPLDTERIDVPCDKVKRSARKKPRIEG